MSGNAWGAGAEFPCIFWITSSPVRTLYTGSPELILSSMFRPRIPITLLVFAEVLGEHGPGPVFLCYGKCGAAEPMVFGDAAFGWRTFAKDRRGILGYLDELGSDDGIKPYKVGKHLFCLFVLHAEEVIPWSILKVREM